MSIIGIGVCQLDNDPDSASHFCITLMNHFCISRTEDCIDEYASHQTTHAAHEGHRKHKNGNPIAVATKHGPQQTDWAEGSG